MANPPLIALFTTDLLHGYGSEKYTVQLANALAKKGCSVDLIVQMAGGTMAADIDPRVRQLTIGSWSPFVSVIYLCMYLRRNKPNVMFATMEKPSLMGIVASMLARYKNIVPTIHFDIDAYTTIDYQARRKFLRLLVAVFYRYADTVVAVSTGAGAALQRWIGRKTKIKIIYNGFDLAEMRRRSAEPVTFPWLAEKTVPVIVACGRLVPQKGFDVLIRAFARLRATEPARLIILGEGRLREELEELVVNLGIKDDVAMPGFVENPAAWFAASDIFALSSRTEGFGNVLVEALASDTEIVSTACPSGPEEILQSGAYGYLVPVDDAAAFAVAMKEALARRRLRKAPRPEVRAYVDNTFSLDGMGQSYLALMRRLNDPDRAAAESA